MRIFSAMSLASARMPSATPILGLATKSMAPSSSARIVTSAPRSVSVETITTGIGRRRMSLPRKSMPSMRGISTSSVITSGSSSRIISRASRGSAAAPTHSMSGSRLMISASRLRTSAESSTTTTRVFFKAASLSRFVLLRRFGGRDQARSYTVCERSRNRSREWAKFSEWPANSKAPGAIARCMRSSTRRCVGASK